MPFGIWSLLPGRAQCKWTFSFQVSKVLLPAQGSLFNISQHRGRRLLRVPWTTRRSNQFILKEISPEYSLEGLMWNWNTNTLATWCKELTHWKRPWCWKRLKVQGERADRGWDGWMASPTQWAWVWVNSGNWWWTGRPGVLQSMGSHRAWHDWATELKWTELNIEGMLREGSLMCEVGQLTGKPKLSPGLLGHQTSLSLLEGHGNWY